MKSGKEGERERKRCAAIGKETKGARRLEGEVNFCAAQNGGRTSRETRARSTEVGRGNKPKWKRERERARMPVSREMVRGKQINIGPGSNSLAAPHTPPQMGMRGSAAYIFIVFILYVYIYSYVHKIQCPDPSQWPAQASGAAHTRMYRYKLLGPPPSRGRLPMYTPPSYVHRRYTPPPRQGGRPAASACRSPSVPESAATGPARREAPRNNKRPTGAPLLGRGHINGRRPVPNPRTLPAWASRPRRRGPSPAGRPHLRRSPRGGSPACPWG